MPTARPNIVLILTDDHASHAVGAYGSVINRTPRIDEIAASGALLEQCFCTNSLCAPSRASVLTGTYSHVNGVMTPATSIDASQPTFVSLLREAGYRTAIVGKRHLGEGEGHDPQGFDSWLRWLDTLEGDAPWCLLIHHKAPHRPCEPDEAHAGMYADPIPVPRTFFDDHASRSAAARQVAMRFADHMAEEDLKSPVPEGLTYEQAALWKYQRYVEDHLAVVASVDDNVGRVIDRLRERGEWDDTLVVYTARIAPGQRYDGIVTNVDTAQTILDAAGVPPHERMQGRSFLPELTGGAGEPPAEGVYYRHWEHMTWPHIVMAHSGYRDDRYKLICLYNDGMGIEGASPYTDPPEWELYDLERDPAELMNVIAGPAYAAVREDMTAKLWRAQAAAGDAPHPRQPRPVGV